MKIAPNENGQFSTNWRKGLSSGDIGMLMLIKNKNKNWAVI